MNRRHPYLLLDAGGALVCPNAELLARVAEERGYIVAPSTLVASFFTRVHRFDTYLRARGADPDVGQFLVDVLVLGGVGPDDAAPILERAKSASKPRTLWTYALPGSHGALAELRAAGFRMSVVSNSDGSVLQQMEDLRLLPYLDRVFDSHVLGVSKPDPAILRHVLAELSLTPEECIYAGDVVMVDVACANACGMRAVHLDPLGLDQGWPGVRTSGVPALAAALIAGKLDLDDPRLLAFTRT